ncbi:MAG: CBS domain-containing protein [Spirochaetota bacterium]
MKISEILDRKGRDVHTIEEDKSLLDFTSSLAEKKIGCLLVKNSDDNITGIVTERDLVKIFSKINTDVTKVKIKDFMTPLSMIITINENEDIQNAMAIMTGKKIRHLPVINDKNKICGILSIGDLVNALLTIKDTQIMMLQDYINGKYPG